MINIKKNKLCKLETLKNISVCVNKWMISNIIISVKQEFLKPFKCVQAND